MRQATVYIDQTALQHNFNRVKALAPNAKVVSMVKANAYGHGIERVFEGLRSADGFALLDLDEAERLRRADWRGPILLLEGCFEARDLEVCSRLNLWHVVHTAEQIEWLSRHKTHTPHRVFLKMNSGMNRLGFAPAQAAGALARLRAHRAVRAVTLMTHFAAADEAPDGPGAAYVVFGKKDGAHVDLAQLGDPSHERAHAEFVEIDVVPGHAVPLCRFTGISPRRGQATRPENRD